MSSTSMTEEPGFIRESQTAYGKLWNIGDKYTMYQPFYTNGQPEAIKITQEMIDLIHRSEERRVGKERRSRWWRDHEE